MEHQVKRIDEIMINKTVIIVIMNEMEKKIG